MSTIQLYKKRGCIDKPIFLTLNTDKFSVGSNRFNCIKFCIEKYDKTIWSSKYRNKLGYSESSKSTAVFQRCFGVKKSTKLDKIKDRVINSNGCGPKKTQRTNEIILYGLNKDDIHGMVVRFYDGQVNKRYQNQTVQDSYKRIKEELEGKGRVGLFFYDESTGKSYCWDHYLSSKEDSV